MNIEFYLEFYLLANIYGINLSCEEVIIKK